MTSKKLVIFTFENSQQVKEVIANGHEKLNRLMIAQTSQIISAKDYLKWLITFKDIASQSSDAFQTWCD